MMHTLIIAEAGVNHNGDLALAKQLIEVAAAAGADLVKFQTFNADRLVTSTASKADYQTQTTEKNETQHAMLRRLEMSTCMHEELIAHCEKHRIGFFSTAFDLESIDFLVGLKQNLFKIPSGELTNLPYLRHIGQLNADVIISTGMANLGDVEAALEVLETSGTPREKITILHCTTAYPTPMHEVNLRAMQTLQTAFGVKVGYSDHTSGIEVATAAVAMGASVIEKHFTLDRNLPGPDHQASLELEELTNMVKAIRNIEQALGDGLKRLVPGEIKNRSLVRKSIVAARPIKAGEVFNGDNLTTKRPGGGISPMSWDAVMDRLATRDYVADELIDS
ncbi:MAG: N-acetylneuraminate synthase [Legionellaceae bacterium]|nr:N-acetylneuraminate synthase [Legionellaceae bacterium]